MAEKKSDWRCDYCDAGVDENPIQRFRNIRCVSPPREIRLCSKCLVSLGFVDAENPFFQRWIEDEKRAKKGKK